MTYHQSDALMRCHYCGAVRRPPEKCPACGSPSIRYFGAGTQKVAEEAQKLFPDARILRMDMDTTRGRDAHEKLLSAFRRGEADILIGTQMIAKGLDFPNVTLVGVVAADMALNLPDYRSAERTFQLITRFPAARAGRRAPAA
jgi:primosomal protein N' (replication factor Y)